jgi:glycosyltransferase involved in cell wall biosynthesis
VIIATVPSVAMLLATAMVSRVLRVPFVADMRDAWPDLLEVVDHWDDTVAGGRQSHKLHRSLRRLGAAGASRAITALQRRAAAVVTTTDGFASRLRSRGIREVHVVRNGAHASASAQGKPDEIRGCELRVLYAGTIGRSQGLATAVEAAALARERGTRIVLRLVGTGAESEALAELARSLQAPVEFVPQLPRAELSAHHAWADTLLVSLRRWPGLLLTVPSKLYEAMSLGIHVSGSVGGEAAEIITATGAGHVSPPGDAPALADMWTRLAEDRRGLEIGEGGRTWALQHACDDRLAGDYERLLEEVTLADAR